MRERSNRVEDVLVRFWRGMRWVRMFLLLVDERKREGGKMREKVKRRGGRGTRSKEYGRGEERGVLNNGLSWLVWGVQVWV